MTNEEKQLLLPDLCARLPYGIIVHIHDIDVDDYDRQLIGEDLDFIELDRRNCKPYLRPMSSLTKEERSELRQWGCLCMSPDDYVEDIGVYGAIHSIPVIDWLNAHHFDFRGLIEKGLAIEAPEGMYN